MQIETIEDVLRDQRFVSLDIEVEVEKWEAWTEEKGILYTPKSLRSWLEKALARPEWNAVRPGEALEAVRRLKKGLPTKQFLETCTPEELEKWRKS